MLPRRGILREGTRPTPPAAAAAGGRFLLSACLPTGLRYVAEQVRLRGIACRPGSRTRGDMRGSPDERIVTAALHGDRQALEELVTASLPLLYNVVGRALHGHPDTDDVVQDTALRMLRGLPGLRDPGAYRSWLVATAIHRIRDHMQARQ